MLCLAGTSGVAPLGSGAPQASRGAGGSGGLPRLAVILMATIIPSAAVVSQSTLSPCPELLWPAAGASLHSLRNGLQAKLLAIDLQMDSKVVQQSAAQHSKVATNCSTVLVPWMYDVLLHLTDIYVLVELYKSAMAPGASSSVTMLSDIMMCRCWQLWRRQSSRGRRLSRRLMRQTYRLPIQAALVG